MFGAAGGTRRGTFLEKYADGRSPRSRRTERQSPVTVMAAAC